MYKIINNDNPTYAVVFDETLGENIILHPSTQEHRTIIEGDYIMLDDKHWTLAANNRHKKDIHAVRCGCKSCRGTLTELFETVENSGGKVITYDKDNPEDFKDKVTNIFESFKK